MYSGECRGALVFDEYYCVSPEAYVVPVNMRVNFWQHA